MKARDLAACALIGTAVALVGFDLATSEDATAKTTPASASLRTVESFATIGDARARSVALFEEAGRVITSPRCLNCHPKDDRPTQTDAMVPHQPWVVRGKDDQGAPGLRCTTCHHDANFAPAGVPGHPKWHVAPLSMAWQGKSLGQICRQIKDPARNGGKSMEQLLHHMEADTLVGWAWQPGGKRTPAPGTQAQFGQILRAWAKTGAACPE